MAISWNFTFDQNMVFEIFFILLTYCFIYFCIPLKFVIDVTKMKEL